MAQEALAATAARRRLEVLVGRWRVEGKNHALSPDQRDVTVRGEETYELMPGGHFLLSSHFQHDGSGSRRQVGSGVIAGVGEGMYRCDSFDKLGRRSYDLHVEDGAWTFSGENERATLRFDDSARQFDIAWEIVSDGTWQPLCTLRATKLHG